ncbi:MAG: cell division protein FtsK, partial [Mycobacterium sp.]|nr:cell division protein FtsK [Mycobacterium sp.]
MVAKGAGSTARSVGRARDLEPGHRRDGIALGLLAVSVVLAASSWFDAARPVGGWIDSTVRVVIGSAVVLLPILLVALAVLLMRTEPHPEARPRLVLGTAMIALPVLGLWHLWSGAPQDSADRQRVAGFVGFAIGGPLSDGLTPWIATPLLIIGVLFGLLLVTGTTIREVPAVVQSIFMGAYRGDTDDDDDYDDDYDYDEYAVEQAEDFSDGYYDDPAASRGDDSRWPGAPSPAGTPMENYPLDEPLVDETPTVPEPKVRAKRKKEPKPAPNKTDTLVLD